MTSSLRLHRDEVIRQTVSQDVGGPGRGRHIGGVRLFMLQVSYYYKCNVYIYTNIYMCVYIYIFLYIFYMYIYFIYICIYIFIFVDIYIFCKYILYVFIFLYLYIYLYVYIYIYIYIFINYWQSSHVFFYVQLNFNLIRFVWNLDDVKIKNSL